MGRNADYALVASTMLTAEAVAWGGDALTDEVWFSGILYQWMESGELTFERKGRALHASVRQSQIGGTKNRRRMARAVHAIERTDAPV